MPKTQFHPSLPCRNSGFSCGYSGEQPAYSQVTKVSLSWQLSATDIYQPEETEPQVPSVPSQSVFPFRVGCYWESFTVLHSNMVGPAMSFPENRVPQYNFTTEHRVGLGALYSRMGGVGGTACKKKLGMGAELCHLTGYVLE